MCCNHGRQYYRHDRTMIWFFSAEDLKNEIPPAGGVVFRLRKTCHAGLEDCRSGFCWRKKWRMRSANATPPMWVTATGMNRNCLFHHRAHFHQGVACDRLDNREDDEARADELNASCSRCSPGRVAQAPAPLLQSMRNTAPQRTCVGSVPTASKLPHFGVVTLAETCKEDIDGSFFIEFCLLKKQQLNQCQLH